MTNQQAKSFHSKGRILKKQTQFLCISAPFLGMQKLLSRLNSATTVKCWLVAPAIQPFGFGTYTRKRLYSRVLVHFESYCGLFRGFLFQCSNLYYRPIGHKNWVLCIAWSPDGKCLISACKNGVIMSWNPKDGSKYGPVMSAHKQWVTALTWEPYHLNSNCRRLVLQLWGEDEHVVSTIIERMFYFRFASSGKDGSVRIWDVILGQCLRVLTSHTHSVTCLKWGGTGLLYSGSQDRTIKVWRADDVSCIHGGLLNSNFYTMYLLLTKDAIVGRYVSDSPRTCSLDQHVSIEYRLCHENGGNRYFNVR